MGVLQASVLVSALLAALSTLSQPAVGMLVRFSDPPPMDPPEEQSALEKMLDMGINMTAMTSDDRNSLVCNGLQNDVIQCRNVMPFDEYAKLNCARLFGIPVPPESRKKRHSSFSSWNSFDDFWGSPFSGFNNFNNFNSFGSSVLLCPTPADQSFIYRLNPDSANYPAAAIGTEIGINPIAQCLINQIVLPEDPPQVLVEDFRLRANATCPFTQLRLYSYQSLRFPGLCWVLQNFGDLILYRQCSADRVCRGCQNRRFRFGSVPSQKLCIPEYRAVSFWAFCPTLLPGQRFVRDRIIIPMACSCQDVPCELVRQG